MTPVPRLPVRRGKGVPTPWPRMEDDLHLPVYESAHPRPRALAAQYTG
ncbi:hypothetical protein [Nonomuraea sp. NPDC048916]